MDQTESSGAVTDVSSSSTTSVVSSSSMPIGEIPKLVLKAGRKEKQSSKNDSMLSFAQDSKSTRGSSDELGLYHTVVPDKELEVG